MRGWRLVAIDGFEVDLPDTKENAAEFGYAGSGANRSALAKARVVALAECGTHAFLAAEIDSYATGEKTLANRLYQRLRRDELLTADRNFSSFTAWDLATRSGAALLRRAPTQLGLPVVKALPDGSYLSVLINPAIRGTRRRAAILATATQIATTTGTDVEVAELDPTEAHRVRVVDYDVPDRVGNPTGELIVLLSTILDPAQARADELAAAYHQRREEEDRQRPAPDPPPPTRHDPALAATRAGVSGNLGLVTGPLRPRGVNHPRRRGRRPRPRPGLFHPSPAHRPPYRHRYRGFLP